MDTLSETNGIHRNPVTHCDTYGHGNIWDIDGYRWISMDINVVSTTRFPRVLVQYVHCQCGSSAPQRLDELPRAPRCSLARLGLHNPLAHQPLVGVTVQVTCTHGIFPLKHHVELPQCLYMFNIIQSLQSFSYVFQHFPAPVN